MIKNKQNKFIFILSFILLVSLIVSPNIDEVEAVKGLPKASHEFYVYDEAKMIDRDLEDYIVGVNKELYNKTGAQIVVAVIDSLDGIDINTYATSLYEEWEIGSKEYDNGLLVLISNEDSEVWIETGYGLEGALPAGRLKSIIENDILPSFRENNFNEGINYGFSSIIEYVEKDYDIELDKESFNAYSPARATERSLPIIPIILLVIVFGFVDIRFFRGYLIISILRAFFSGRGGGGFGGGSGGSSGGGGRSGGGGAGGSW